MRFRCEARKPGRKSFEFATVDMETGRAVCDAQGWEYIRCYEVGSDSDRPATKPAKGDKPLSTLQMRCLVTEANKTWKHLSNMGVITDLFDEWRHNQVWACVRRDGLKACSSSHYRKLLSHFRSLRGAADPGGQVGKSWSREGGDTEERRTQILRALAAELGHHARRVEKPQTPAECHIAAIANEKGGVINEDYLMSIARAKNPGTTLHDTGCLIKLPASRLEHLLFTLRNRIAAREGRGETKKRNKGQ